MKYLFINSVAGFGSTGRLAAQTCRELVEQGNTCVLAFGREESSCADVPTVRIGSPWDCRIHALKSRILDDQGFESRAATRRFLAWVREYDPAAHRGIVFLSSHLRKGNPLDPSRLLELYRPLRLF